MVLLGVSGILTRQMDAASALAEHGLGALVPEHGAQDATSRIPNDPAGSHFIPSPAMRESEPVGSVA